MPQTKKHVTKPIHLRIGPQGRIVIPAPFRRALDLKPGDVVAARVIDDHLVIKSHAAALEALRRLFDQIPRDVDLVEELHAERREEFEREERWMNAD